MPRIASRRAPTGKLSGIPYEKHAPVRKPVSAKRCQICDPRPVVRIPAYWLPLALFFGPGRSPCISQQPARRGCALD